MPKGNIYEALGSLLTYPEAGLQDSIDGCVTTLKANGSSAVPMIEEFAKYVQASTIENLQEIYTQTFEFNPDRALEVGWHLFGERYERGTFIVKMRQTLRKLDLPESTELPDHLTHVLAALDRMDNEEANEFVKMFVMPAILKIIAGFKDPDNKYTMVLNGIRCELSSRYNLPG